MGVLQLYSPSCIWVIFCHFFKLTPRFCQNTWVFMGVFGKKWVPNYQIRKVVPISYVNVVMGI